MNPALSMTGDAGGRKSGVKVLIAAGGSGGHIFPAIALAKKLKDRSPETDILFVGSNKALDKRIFEKEGFRFFLLSGNRLPYRASPRLVIFLIKLLYDFFLSLFILFYYRPNVVIGFGGYVTWPIVVTSFVCGIPRMIHEQNALPGRANKSLFALADKIAISFKETGELIKKFKEKVIFTGNPIRDDVLTDRKSDAIKDFGLNTDKFTILVIGGSQGAHSLNEAIIKAISGMDEKMRSGLQLIHITGIKDYEFGIIEYGKIRIDHRVYSFIDRIEEAYSASDMVVTRSGASAIFEIACFGRPMVLVPYAFANAHQAENAKVFSDAGAAIVINEKDISAVLMRDKLLYLIENKEARDKLADSARRLGVPKAADNLAEAVFDLVKKDDIK